MFQRVSSAVKVVVRAVDETGEPRGSLAVVVVIREGR